MDNETPRVKFPLGALLAGIAVDVADWLGIFDGGIISYVVLLALFQLPVTGYLTYWFYRRGTSAAGKQALKASWKRLFLLLGAEFVPYLEFLPWTAAFVWETYRTEKKGAQMAEFDKKPSPVTREKRGVTGPATPESARAAGVTREKRS